MALEASIGAFIDGWRRRSPDAAAAALGAAGSYTDPLSGGPLEGAAAVAAIARVCDAIPDLTLDTGALATGDRITAVEWVLRGTNAGPFLPSVPPTGQPVALPGVSVFEGTGSGALHVRSYFDQKALVEQIGLMALVQPMAQDQATFGYSMRVVSGNRNAPGVIALTWIAARDGRERDRIRNHSRTIVQNFLEEPGFIGIVTGFTGLCGFTVTAWEDEASLARGLARQHRTAMRELRTEDFVPAVWTSVWSPLRINRIWTRCLACARLEDVSDDRRACSGCGADLPERQPFW